MREIEFRGQHIHSDEWIIGQYLKRGFSAHTDYSIWTPKGTIPVKSESIGQFTGLSDKNDNKIFEGKNSLKMTIIGLGEGFVDVVMKDGQWFIFSESQGFAPLFEMLNNSAIELEVNNDTISAKNFVNEAKLFLKIKDMDKTSAANYLHSLNMEEWEIKELLDK